VQELYYVANSIGGGLSESCVDWHFEDGFFIGIRQQVILHDEKAAKSDRIDQWKLSFGLYEG
jgi:hypothetical protein